jgi:hypothetical protein
MCRAWFERLWVAVCQLRERYMLPVRTRWWENPIQLEALAALAEWVDRYDSGEWDDPPGNLPGSNCPPSALEPLLEQLQSLFGSFAVEVEVPQVESEDTSGQRFGHLVVRHHVGRVGRHQLVMADCDCGTKRRVSLGVLMSGKITSCGCETE